ncbi:MAG TPA: hypothetical protein VFA65_24515 [Bryobacteraceae bacterium]|nr:hypothetical protein [Bryobacteraceae bacterium]
MMTVLKPTYSLSIEIQRPFPQQSANSLQGVTVGPDGNLKIPSGLPPFWEAIKGTGCDEVVAAIKELLAERFPECHVRLTGYSEEA